MQFLVNWKFWWAKGWSDNIFQCYFASSITLIKLLFFLNIVVQNKCIFGERALYWSFPEIFYIALNNFSSLKPTFINIIFIKICLQLKSLFFWSCWKACLIDSWIPKEEFWLPFMVDCWCILQTLYKYLMYILQIIAYKYFWLTVGFWKKGFGFQ